MRLILDIINLEWINVIGQIHLSSALTNVLVCWYNISSFML